MYQIKLSPYARIFYTEWLLELEGGRYNLSIDQTLYGNVDIEKLRSALKRYISENVLLNSHIETFDGEPRFVPNEKIYDMDYSNSLGREEERLSYVRSSFDLYTGPLYRFKLLRVCEEIYRFVVVMHHIIMDGSASLDPGVFEAIANYYNDEHYKAKHTIDEQVKLINDLAENLYARVKKNDAEYKKFWQEQLSDAENIDLRFLRRSGIERKERPVHPAMEICKPMGATYFNHGETELAKLKQIKQKYGVSSYVYGQIIFALLLHRYTSQDQVAIAYPLAIKEGMDFFYGAQINTNIIPYKFSADTTVANLFKQSQEFFRLTMRDGIKYGYCPITNIIQASSKKYLLDVYFAQTFFREKPFAFAGITRVETHTELSTDGATGNVLLFEQDARDNHDNRINYRIRYDKNTVDDELLNNFIATYKRLFAEVLDDLLAGKDDRLISSYNLLTPEQYHKIVYEFNNTDRDYPRDKTIHELFEEQVERTPDNVAVVYENRKLTYRELNAKANQLAHYLRHKYKVKPDDLVVLCLDRNEYAIVAMLGVLKAGGAYVPMDPKHPDERIKYVLEDTKAKVMLTNGQHKDRLQKIAKNVSKNVDAIAIDSNREGEELAKQESTNPKAKTLSTDLMYVIYTSGTTGNPKGVLVEHRSVVNYVTYLICDNKLSAKSIGSQYAGHSFDALVIELYPMLLSGGALYIMDDKDKFDLDAVHNFFKRSRINYAFLPTKFAELFLSKKNTSLENLIAGGEKLEYFTEQKYRMINAYGPTESTVQSTSFVVGGAYGNIPIGKPVSNIKCYVVDNDKNLLPTGVIGELFIGGESLARGYLNLPNLTAEKFISNPFQTEEEKAKNKNRRLYKTGDLVRLLPDGNLEYIGRNDCQIKLRGHRIELGEIEQRLAGFPGVERAVVLLKENHGESINKYLVAYYVARAKLDDTKIRNYLSTHLPEYMVPAILVYLPNLPLTGNGKLDKKALPEVRIESNEQYVKPTNEQEQIICQAFAKVLKKEKVGIHDNFFENGGNSIHAIQLVAILQSKFDIKVPDIFKLRTPEQIARNSYFGKNVLRKKLEQVKISYQNTQNKTYVSDEQLQKKVAAYLDSSYGRQDDYFEQKMLSNVLLTGATGYLGCNILNQLLKSTDYNIFLLVRDKSQEEAFDRIHRKFQFYFGREISIARRSQIFTVAADLEADYLGLTPEVYKTLAMQIDSVIHSAALVKHYGEYDKFYSANVQATINLLEFTKLTKQRDFHYISTYSVLNCGFIPGCEEYVYTEDDSPDNLTLRDNIYVQTKLQGEQAVIKYREQGVDANIYRVGNLAFMAENYRVQENIEDNAFFNWLKCLFKMQYASHDLNLVEISPVDLTARAIVKLFDKKRIKNYNCHVFNPNLFDLFHAFSDNRISPVTTLTMAQFVDNVVSNLNSDIYHDLIIKFLLRQGWLDDWNIKTATSIKVLQNKTQHILKQLGFEWSPISNETFNKYLESLKLYGVNEMTKKARILEYLEKIAPLLPTPVYWLGLNQEYLGMNELVIKSTGTLSYGRDFAGKTPYNLYPEEMAKDIVHHHKEVIRTGKVLSAEESIKDVSSGEIKYFNATIAPLRDDDGKIIGTVGTSVDITAEKKEAERLKRAKIFEHLEKIAQIVPAPFYWLGMNQEYLGINDFVIKGTGTKSFKDDFSGGRTPYDVYPEEMAENIVQHHKQVIKTEKILSAEETIKDATTGEIKCLSATIAPLRDDDDKIIGTVGISIDITAEKKEAERLKRARVFEHLERIARIIPTPIYWLGLNQEYLGINELVVKASGTRSFEKDFAGKIPYDLYPHEMAEEIVQHHKNVINTGELLCVEESIKDVTTGKNRYFDAFIAPLFDDNGKIIGTIGTSIETTAEKEAERLKLIEQELAEQQKFTKAANQVAHDIRSPLATLMILTRACGADLPEDTRIALREAVAGIGDIADSMLSRYRPKELTARTEALEETETRNPVLISLVLQQLLIDKKYQCRTLPITFTQSFCDKCNFVFINVNQTSLKRMLSNLINNSVDAFEGKTGQINLEFSADEQNVMITLHDNGKGMPQEIIDKITSDIAVTSGKKEGHGIGFTQIREALRHNQGTMNIESEVGTGTKIMLTFPKVSPPEWITDEIRLNDGDTIIILDDDTSIHGAWEARFKSRDLASYKFPMQHFKLGTEAIDFINAFPDKNKLMLLADYELLKQDLNGLHVVERTRIPRSILVTSHNADPIVQNLAIKTKTKILPKQLASEVIIKVCKRADSNECINLTEQAKKPQKVVNIVLIDDNNLYRNAFKKMVMFLDEAEEYTLDDYADPYAFLEHLDKYPKDTKICMDHDFEKDINGFDLAAKLHDAGYTKLYMFSGTKFKPSEVPDYLTVLLKTKIDEICETLLGK